MVYVDANVFISSFLSQGQKTEHCKSILSRIASNDIPAFTSLLTWDEIAWIARKRLSIEDSIEEGKKFLEFPYLRLVEVNELIIKMAQDMMERYNLKPRDAIHAATAISNGIKEIVSDDPDFDVIKEIKRIPIEKFR